MRSKIISVYLSLSLLAGSVGIHIYTHTCHLFDTRDHSLVASEECCSSDSESSSLEWKCCSVELNSYEIDDDIEKQKQSNHQSIAVGEALAIPQANFTFPIMDLGLATYRPPPTNLNSKTYLTEIQVFLL